MKELSSILYRPTVLRALALLALGYGAYYLIWRWQVSLNPTALAFALAFFAAEAVGLCNFLLFAFITWDTRVRFPFLRRDDLKVDVFVACADEPTDIIEATLTACNEINYPHRTYVVDERRRPEVRALTRRLRCRYLTGPEDKPGKMRSINAALSIAKGEFILLLDADAVPQPDLLDRTLGYFCDERVAVVQLPREYYNVDSVQHPMATKPEDWHEQSLFFRVMQPGKNRWRSALWCGSPSVLRRAALDGIGGVATETVTEDLHTTMRLHAAGWRTVYHNEALAFGIAPQTLLAFGAQRLRWVRGTAQLLGRIETWRLALRMSMSQRLNYAASVFTYFETYQKMAFLVVPSLILVTGLLPINVGGWDFFWRWSVSLGLIAVAKLALGRGEYSFLRAETYNLLKVFTLLWALVETGLAKYSVRRTPHQPWQQRRNWLPAWIHFTGLAILAITLLIGLANLRWSFSAAFSNGELALAAILWTCVNFALVVLATLTVLPHEQRRSTYRFPVNMRLEVMTPRGQYAGTTLDLSQRGVGLKLPLAQRGENIPSDLRIGKRISVRLSIGEDRVEMPATVTTAHLVGQGLRLGASYSASNGTARRDLLLFLFVCLPRVLWQERRPEQAPQPAIVAA